MHVVIWLENLMERYHLEDLSVDGNRIQSYSIHNSVLLAIANMLHIVAVVVIALIIIIIIIIIITFWVTYTLCVR